MSDKDFQVIFTKSANKNTTCCVNNCYAHSKYNPQKEAQTFAQNIKCDFSPKNIFIAEPVLCYCIPFLKERFSNSKITIIRYTNLFDKYNAQNCQVFYFENQANFEIQLRSHFSSEDLCSSLFIEWPASQNIFSENSSKYWKSIKNILQNSKIELITKSYFSKTWIKNSIIFFKYATNFASFNTKNINCPIVITASGNSLKDVIPCLKQNLNKIFLICVSSALSVLLKNEITPDLVISTDGGYWAKLHLKKLIIKKQIPLAISSESACQKQILISNAIIPLCYKDGIESDLTKIFLTQNSLSFLFTERNGTVSGNALKIAQNLTDKKIYLCGLDLSPSPSFQHSQPNELEISAMTTDNKLSTNQKRSTISRFNAESLKIYENWFSSIDKNEAKRIFRLANNYNFSNNLNNIKDIQIKQFEDDLKENPIIQKDFFSYTKIKSSTKKNEKIIDELNKITKTQEWLKYVFPSDYMLYEKYIDTTQKEKKLIEIHKKNTDFFQKISRILNGAV